MAPTPKKNNKVCLIFAKSNVFAHPVMDVQSGISGYLTIVKQKASPYMPTYLMAWVPENLIPSEEKECYVLVETNFQDPTITITEPSLYSTNILSKYTASFALSDINTIELKPPSSFEAGKMVVTLRGKIELPPFWFWKKEEEVSGDQETQEEGVKTWAGEDVINAIGKLAKISREGDIVTVYHELSFPDRDVLERTPTDDIGWNVLDAFSKVALFSKQATASVLKHKLAEPFLPYLPQQVVALKDDTDDRDLMSEFESARLYLAKWAAGTVANWNKRNADMRYRSSAWEKGREASTGIGKFEILSHGNETFYSKRTPPLNAEDWISFFDEEGRLKVDKDNVLEKIFFGGMEPEIRVIAWGYLLNFYNWNSTEAERAVEYKEKTEAYILLKKQWESILQAPDDEFRKSAEYQNFFENKHRIAKDVVRTDRDVEMFSLENGETAETNPGLKQMTDILLTYTTYNPELEYVQGMSDLLGPLIVVFSDEVMAFWCFVNLMNRAEKNFLQDQSGMHEQLSSIRRLIRFMDPPFYSYLEKMDACHLFFCFRWIIVWFKREFVFQDILRLWEVALSDHLTKHFFLFVAMGILDRQRDVIMDHLCTFDEVLKYINELSNTLKVEQVISDAEVMIYRLKDRLERYQEAESAAASTSEGQAGPSLNEEKEEVNFLKGLLQLENKTT